MLAAAFMHDAYDHKYIAKENSHIIKEKIN